MVTYVLRLRVSIVGTHLEIRSQAAKRRQSTCLKIPAIILTNHNNLEMETGHAITGVKIKQNASIFAAVRD